MSDTPLRSLAAKLNSLELDEAESRLLGCDDEPTVLGTVAVIR